MFDLGRPISSKTIDSFKYRVVTGVVIHDVNGALSASRCRSTARSVCSPNGLYINTILRSSAAANSAASPMTISILLNSGSRATRQSRLVAAIANNSGTSVCRHLGEVQRAPGDRTAVWSGKCLQPGGGDTGHAASDNFVVEGLFQVEVISELFGQIWNETRYPMASLLASARPVGHFQLPLPVVRIC